MSEKIAKIIRVCTVPPIMAVVLASLLYFAGGGIIKDKFHYLMAVLFLCALPLFAYPASLLIPRESRRDMQRNTAIILSVIGYVAGTVFAFSTDAPDGEKVLYLTYLFSGVLTAVMSFALRIKASGHSCGVSGPAAMLVYRLGFIYLPFAPILLALVFSSSLVLKRHSMMQLVTGALIPIVSMFAAIALV